MSSTVQQPVEARRTETPATEQGVEGRSGSRAGATGRRLRWRAGRVVGLVAAVALLGAFTRAVQPRGGDRTASLVAALERRGLIVDPDGVVWLEQPPVGVLRAAAGSVPVAVRARPRPEEPHDVYVVEARLSPEGVLLGVGGDYNLTETSAVDEQPPSGRGLRFAFVEQSMLEAESGARVQLFDLGATGRAGSGRGASAAGGTTEGRWNRLQRMQAAVTRLQQTGRLDRIGHYAYALPKGVTDAEVGWLEGSLTISAEDRTAEISFDQPLAVPDWLAAEHVLEPKPGNLVTWAVDRVRGVSWIGDNTMQYIKAIAFSALDVVLRSKEAVTGDTGADDIASDLGQETLAPPTREIPVDPDIGFPPPPLEPWVTPALPGEGRWNLKDDDPFIRKLPGLPPAFLTTFIRGDRKRKVTRVYIALWDPRQVELHTMAGLAEPKSATGRTGPGLIPREPKVLRRVAAACNAGFQSLHGEYGMMSDGVIYLPPKPYAATVAVLRDGSTAFGTWPKAAAIPNDMLSYRQNMTPMVVDGKYNPYGRTWWGGTPSDWEDKTHTTRTGICVTAEGFVGYFYGADLSPKALGRAMIQARCSYGVALDMNAGHSGLEFYHVAPTDQMPALDRPLRKDWEREGEVPYMDGWSFRARRLIRGMGLMYFPRYIKREGRDYFYMTLRHLLPGPPVPPAGGAGEAAEWTVKGLAQHGFPYAVATAEVKLSSGSAVRLLKMDPRMVTPFEQRARKRAGASGQAAGGEGDAPPAVVAALVVPPAEERDPGLSIWSTPEAFSVGAEPPLKGAVRLVTGRSPESAARSVAAAGVQQEAGMLVYVEAAGQGGDPPAPVATADLVGVLARLDVTEPVVLSERVSLALGGDTDLAGQATRLAGEGARIDLYRMPGPGARRIFRETPVVAMSEWYPLQARRIRYFKKKKKSDDDGGGDDE